MRGLRTLLSISIVAMLASAALAATSVRLPDEVAGPTGSDVAVRIAADTGGQDLASLDLAFTFDDALLELRGVYRTALTHDFALFQNIIVNPAGPDTLDLALYTGSPVPTPAGYHDAVWVVFRVRAHPGRSDLLWNAGDTWVNDSPPVTLEDGSITAEQASVGFAMPDDAIAPATHPASSVWVPIMVEPAQGLHAFDVEVRFDPSVIEATDVAATPATSGFTLTSNLGTPGRANLSLFSRDTVIGSGRQEIARILFRVVGGPGEQTPLDLTLGVTDDAFSTHLDDGLFTICPDADLDGVSACEGDCDDADPARYPGHAEVCDGKDNDCNGDVDEGVLTTFHRDGDADGFGDPAVTQAACAAPPTFVTNGLDCNDANGAIHPGANDSSCNAVDDDCDGTPDDHYVPVTTTCGAGSCRPTGTTSCIAGQVQDSCTLSAAPGETALDLHFIDTTTMHWSATAGASAYNAYRGRVDGAAWNDDHTCLAGGSTNPTASDPSIPASDSGYYYLVSARNDCGEGTLGTESDGTPRPQPAACP